jgi:DNA-binding transcriptional regulator YiaG
MTPADFSATRHSLGLTQAAIAPLLGVSPRTVQDWEIGRRKISKTVALLLARVVAESGVTP